jgi:hypothetical protein
MNQPRRLLLEPKQERHHLIVGQVVGKLRADDEVRLGLRRLVEHIAGLPGDHGAGRGGSHGLDGAAWRSMPESTSISPRRVAQL